MKNNNLIEVILFSNYSFRDPGQKELVRWLGTAAQAAINRQQQRSKKIFLKTLKNTTAIYLS